MTTNAPQRSHTFDRTLLHPHISTASRGINQNGVFAKFCTLSIFFFFFTDSESECLGPENILRRCVVLRIFQCQKGNDRDRERGIRRIFYCCCLYYDFASLCSKFHSIGASTPMGGWKGRKQRRINVSLFIRNPSHYCPLPTPPKPGVALVVKPDRRRTLPPLKNNDRAANFPGWWEFAIVPGCCCCFFF